MSYERWQLRPRVGFKTRLCLFLDVGVMVCGGVFFLYGFGGVSFVMWFFFVWVMTSVVIFVTLVGYLLCIRV